jgi:V8-like Glu-specific endopeptidase
MFYFSAAPYSADRAYPYITVGKLFFTADGRPAFCSASVIQHRIVVTAAHCVHTGFRTGHYYANWMFVPAYRDGTAPLGVWNWTALAITTTWLNEGAQPYSSADYAMFEFADQRVNGTLRSLGDLTGWLGWQTLSLHDNHTTKLGYACNLDFCDKMQQITSMGIADIVEQNVLAGGDARNGFDGSPWIQNFQVLQAGGGTGANSGSNRVVGVTSHITAPNPYNQQTLSSSTPDGRWIAVLNAMCGIHAGNCL